MKLKLCVINFSGNVGKTTVAAHLLQPRLPGARLISVESLNLDAEADGLDMRRIRAKRFDDLQREVLTHQDVIVDVGASNAEDFVKLMQQYDGSHEDYDCYVVPAVKHRKQQADTINTIEVLGALGVAPGRIKVVFNRVEPDDAVAEEFAPLRGFAVQRKLKLAEGAVIYANEVFDKLKGTGRTLADVLADPMDYRARMREAADAEERDRCIDRLAVRRLAGSCVKNLDAAFAALFGK